MMKLRPLLILSLFAMALLACSLVSDLLGSADETVGGQGSPQGATLWQDDFADPNSGWEVGEYQTGSVGYSNGVYFVTSVGSGDTMWGVANRAFVNTDIEVVATQIEGPANDNNDYGVVCRLQSDDDGYYLLISGDGFYSILKRDDGEFVELVSWSESRAIQQGNTTNLIRVVCNGPDLALYANGELLGQAKDSTFSEGRLALTATSYEDVATRVHFDNLIVREP